MKKLSIAAFGLAISLLMPLAAIESAHAVTVNINVGSSLNHGRAISCVQGQRLLQNRGFRNVRRVDCRGRVFIYHGTRRGSRFEVALNARTGRVVDVRRLRW